MGRGSFSFFLVNIINVITWEGSNDQLDSSIVDLHHSDIEFNVLISEAERTIYSYCILVSNDQ